MKLPSRQGSAGLTILLLVALAVAARIAWPPKVQPIRPCGDLDPVTVGGSMVVGCRPKTGP